MIAFFLEGDACCLLSGSASESIEILSQFRAGKSRCPIIKAFRIYTSYLKNNEMSQQNLCLFMLKQATLMPSSGFLWRSLSSLANLLIAAPAGPPRACEWTRESDVRAKTCDKYPNPDSRMLTAGIQSQVYPQNTSVQERWEELSSFMAYTKKGWHPKHLSNAPFLPFPISLSQINPHLMKRIASERQTRSSSLLNNIPLGGLVAWVCTSVFASKWSTKLPFGR